MVNKDNYSKLASQSIGSIVNAEFRENDNEKIVYGTLRITNENIINDLKNKRINGGSLGYYADMSLENGKKTQTNIRPNHFCLTHHPRDRGVTIFNSKKGAIMDKEQVVEIINSMLEAKTAQMKAESEFVKIPKEKFNSFMQTVESRIKDTNVKAICNSKIGVDKIDFIDNALSLKDIFTNSDDEKLAKEEGKAEAQAKDIKKDEESLEGYKAEIEKLKKENSLLAEKIAKKNEEDSKDDDSKKNEEDSKDDDSKKNEEDSKDDDSKKNEEDSKDDEKQNSVKISGKTEVKNSIDSRYAEIASQINF